MPDRIYYLPGRGGRLDTGLGGSLLSRNLEIHGRELRGEFAPLSFADQLQSIADDLTSNFWAKESRVICNSLGAYLFLHALALLDTFPGKILLLSPILGAASDEITGMTFVPPRAEKLLNLSNKNLFPTPKNCQIHVGEHDWQSNPETVKLFCEPQNISYQVVPEAGHQLPQAYVNGVLDLWLLLQN
jgi:hypothetical protein